MQEIQIFLIIMFIAMIINFNYQNRQLIRALNKIEVLEEWREK